MKRVKEQQERTSVLVSIAWELLFRCCGAVVVGCNHRQLTLATGSSSSRDSRRVLPDIGATGRNGLNRSGISRRHWVPSIETWTDKRESTTDAYVRALHVVCSRMFSVANGQTRDRNEKHWVIVDHFDFITVIARPTIALIVIRTWLRLGVFRQ